MVVANLNRYAGTALRWQRQFRFFDAVVKNSVTKHSEFVAKRDHLPSPVWDDVPAPTVDRHV